MKVTVSLIKADVGSTPGHHLVHEKQLEVAKERLSEEKNKGNIIDFYVFNCGDDIELLITHDRGEDSEEIHRIAWDAFMEVTEKVSTPLKLYAAGQDLLADAFSGNIKGLGPGIAEVELEERESEPIVVLAADKTDPGAFNLPLFKIFADPLSTAGLVIDPNMSQGFTFRIMDVLKNRYVDLKCPAEMYELVGLIGTTNRYVIERVFRSADGLTAAVSSTSKLSLIAGKYVGKDDPCAIVRCQHGLPAVGEVLAPFGFPHLVAGFMRGSHIGPLMPVSVHDAKCTLFDGPPRVVALGFNLLNGAIIGPRGSEPADLFSDVAFDGAREKANEITDYIRRHGEFMPARLGAEDLEYTTLPTILRKLEERFKEY